MAEVIERILTVSINDQHVGDLVIDLTNGLIELSPTNANIVMDQKSITFKTEREDYIKIDLGDIKMNGFGNKLFKLSK
jgi:hypothetical protein